MRHFKLLSLGLLFTLILPQNLFSQAPDGVNYQAVVRNALGLALNTQTVSVRFSIHQGSPTGTVVFTETQPTTTNQFGLINLELGSVNNLAFSTINWGTGGAYYLQIEVDAGSGFDDLGASQLLSVPYALFARSAATGQQGYNSLIDTVSATLLECPTGGYRVNAGLDINASTFLEAGEITSSFIVCNGSVAGGDDWGVDTVNVSGANISGSGTAGNPLIVTEVDGNITNEIQTLSINLDTIFLSNGGGSIVLPSLGDNDWIIVGNDMSSGITGNVGIGVLLPSRKLSIRSLVPGGDGIEINNASATGNPGIEFQTQGIPRYVVGVDQTDNNKFKIGTTGVNINTRFTIDNLGQVGIGTINPNRQLSVFSTDTIIANFVGSNPDVAAITVTGANPAAVTGALFLSGVDSGVIAMDPAQKVFFFSNSTAGGHIALYADSSAAMYGQQVANFATSIIYNQSPTIYNEADSIFNFSLTGSNINVNQGAFYTDSLHVLGNNLFNANWVLANDGLGQAVWTDPSTISGGGLWQSNGPDIYYNSGNVGIGMSAPLNALEINTSALNTFARFTNSVSDTLANDGVYVGINGSDAYFNNAENGNMLFYTNNSEKVRIDQNGLVGIGTVTPGAPLHIANGPFGSSGAIVLMSNNTSATNPSDLSFFKSRGTEAAPLPILGNDEIGAIQFNAYNSVSYSTGALIRSIADENYGSTTQGTHLEFHTTAIGTAGPNEVMRIADNGYVGIGRTTPLVKLHIADNAQTILGIESSNATPSDGAHLSLLRSRGLITAPTNVLSGDRIGSVEFLGYNAVTANYDEVISIRGFADETYTGGSTSSHLEFHVNPAGQSTMIEAMRIQGNGFIGLGTATPLATLDVNGTDAIIFPRGTTAQRPAVPVAGMTRYNTALNTLEFYNGVAWAGVGGGPASPWTISGPNIFQLNLTDFVGIGTNTPGGPLHIADANTSNTASQFIIESNSSSGPQTFAAIEFRANATGASVGPVGRINTYYVNPLFTSATMTFQTVTGGPSFVDVMSLTDGKVGIGTTTPISSFNIIYTGADAEASLINYTNNSASAAGTGFYVNANNTGSGIITAGGFQVNNSSNAIETIVLDANNIAIGTTNYGLRTAVAGAGTTNFGIYAEVSGATTNWAAYFANGDVYIQDNLVIPTGAALGSVLTSDAVGVASWQAPKPPVNFSVNTSSTFIPNGSMTQLVFDNVEYDSFTSFSAPLGQFQAPEGGIYHIDATVVFDASANYEIQIYILRNGGIYKTSIVYANTVEPYATAHISADVFLPINNTVSIGILQTSPGPIAPTTSAGINRVYFNGHLIR